MTWFTHNQSIGFAWEFAFHMNFRLLLLWEETDSQLTYLHSFVDNFEQDIMTTYKLVQQCVQVK